MFWSIIGDFNLKTGLCDLVDNALDLWMPANRRDPLAISINLDVGRQLISVKDNSGGAKRDELRLLVAPRGSRNDPGAELIGIFGVGSKRAGIALAEQVVIKTRVARATHRALLRHRRDETNASARAREHSEAAVASRGCVQSEPDLSHPAGIGYSAGVEEPAVLAYFCASLAVPSLFSAGAPHTRFFLDVTAQTASEPSRSPI